MKKSIYELQNPVDFAPYTHEYLIQALANMGQRIGLRGDGIKYDKFTFADIIGTTQYDASKYIGTLTYGSVISGETSILGAYFGVVEKGTLYNKTNNIIAPTTPYYVSTDIRNMIRLQNQLQFDMPINNIEKYSKNSILHNDGSILTTILIGKYFGHDDEDQNNAEIIYNKFNISTGELEYAVRAMYLYSDNTNDYYCIIKTIRETDDKYKVYLQIYNPKYLGNYADEFKKAFCFLNYEDSDFTIFNILRNDISSDYIMLDNLEAYSDSEYVDTSESFDNISIVDMMFHTAANNAVYNKYEFNIDYNKNNDNILFSISDDPVTTANVRYLRTNFNIEVSDYIELLNNDVITLYYNMFKYYNSTYYFSDKQTLATRIICKLYENIANVDIYSDIQDYNTMYIPLDMEFTYASSSANELNIYYSNNIFVTMVDLSSDDSSIELDDFFNTCNTIVFDYDGIRKIRSCAFQIKYNDIYNELVDYIDMVSLYTMPYITQNNTWAVNEEDTGISAVGADAGNPNIIILYSKGDSVAVLSSFANFSDINPSYEKRTFYVNPNMFYNYNSETNIECTAYIPEITSYNIDYFNNSLIISLSAIQNIENSNLHADYIGNYVMSLWKIDSEEYKFNYIVDPLSEDNYDIALTLDNMSSVFAQVANNDIINGAVIKLRAKVYKLAQEADISSEYNWILIKAKTSKEYNTELGIESNDDRDKYQNDLNVILQVNKTITTVGNVIKTNPNDSKYITFGDLDHIDSSYITNVIYPKYISYSTTTEEEITEDVNIVPERDIYYVNTDDYGHMITSVEQLTNLSNAIDEQHTTIVTTTTTTSYLSENEFYNEYVFNSDVPSFDLREILLRNINTTNRVNIVSLDSTGHMYNAYIGTSWNEEDKSTLHIGTSESNINIGNSTLMNDYDKYSKFVKHDSLSLDFNHIVLNSNNLEMPAPLTRKEIDGKIYYSAQVRPSGKISEHGMYAYTWDYMVRRYNEAHEEFGSVITERNGVYFGINSNIDINPNTKLYICGTSNENTDLQITTALRDKLDSNVIFRRLYIFADSQPTYDEIVSGKEYDEYFIPEQTGSTWIYSKKRIIDMYNLECNIGDQVNNPEDGSISNINVVIQPIDNKKSVEFENGNVYARRNGVSVVSIGNNTQVVYAKYNIDPITGSYIYGYNTIDIYNLMRYYLGIDLDTYSSVNITSGKNVLIKYTSQVRKYWYLLINDDIFDKVEFNTNSDYDLDKINTLNDYLDITLWFNDGEINIDISFDTTNRTSELNYYISEPQKDSIFDKQSIG